MTRSLSFFTMILSYLRMIFTRPSKRKGGLL